MSVYEAVKDALKLAQSSDNAPLIRDLTTALIESAQLSADNIQLQQRVRDLESALRFKESLTNKHGVLWAAGDEAPYCRFCWEKSKLAIHLDDFGRYEGKDRMVCLECKGEWFIPGNRNQND